MWRQWYSVCGGGGARCICFYLLHLLQQVAAATAEQDKSRSEYQNAVRESGQLQSQLEMSQSEVRMMRMALAEKESEVSRACDETLYVAGYPLLLQQESLIELTVQAMVGYGVDAPLAIESLTHTTHTCPPKMLQPLTKPPMYISHLLVALMPSISSLAAHACVCVHLHCQQDVCACSSFTYKQGCTFLCDELS